MKRQDLESRGLDQAAAALAVRRALGNLPLTRDLVRDVWIAPWLGAMQDVRYGLRTLRRHPGFAAVAIATLSLGIGASTATFSIADAVLMRPLPVHEQRNLSVLWGVDPAVGAGRLPVPYGAFKGFADASPRALSAVAGVDYHGAGTLPVRERGEGVNLKVALVTGNLFDVLGVTPLLGRNIRAEDDSVAAAPVVAISYDLWQRRYGANPAALGRVLTIRGQAATIVAVMPRGFGFPARTEVWATARPFRPVAETGPPNFYVYLVGRLAPGATIEQSASELTNYLESNPAALPMLLRGMTAAAETFDDDLLGDVLPVILLLLVASALVLLVASVNVGALLLALELTRRQELAVRVALGATARRLLLLALGDALIVAVAAAVFGVAIAHAVVRVVVAFASTQLPRTDAIEVNGVTLAFAVAVAVAATVAFAISRVYGQRRLDPSRVLNAASRGGTHAARRTQRVLVVAQVTLAVAVILGAGLVARSQLNLETLELGLAGDRILMVQVVPPQQDDWANPRRFNANLDRVIEAVAPLPGVQGVAPVLTEPFAGMSDGWDARYLLEGQAPEEQTRQPLLNFGIASPAFFRTLGIGIVRGRAFTDEDSAEGRPVLILNESAAGLAWPDDKDAVGERMKISGQPWATVIGVAADTRYRELTAIRPTVYRPRAQFEAAPGFLAVRTAGDPDRPRCRDSQRRPGGVAGCDVHVVTAARRLLVRAARALTRDRRSVRRVCRDLPAAVHDRSVRRRDGPRGGAHPRGRHPDGARRVQECRAPNRPTRGRNDGAHRVDWRRGDRRALQRLARIDPVWRRPPRPRDDRRCRAARGPRDRCRDLYSCQTRRKRRADGGAPRVMRSGAMYRVLW